MCFSIIFDGCITWDKLKQHEGQNCKRCTNIQEQSYLPSDELTLGRFILTIHSLGIPATKDSINIVCIDLKL